VRGSPLIRSILLALVLGGAGAVLWHVTIQKTTPNSPARAVAQLPSTDGIFVPFHLVLSAPASTVTINGGQQIQLTPADSSLTGKLEMDPQNPRIALNIHWVSAANTGEHRFAKITLEVPAQETFTHVFDAQGDIDDFIELPATHSKND